MIYALTRSDKDTIEESKQLRTLERYAKGKRIRIRELTNQSIGAKNDLAGLNRLIEKKLRQGDELLIPRLSILGTSFVPVIESVKKMVGKGAIIHSVGDSLIIGGKKIDFKLLAEAFAISLSVERSLINQRVTVGLEKRRASGRPLGRPKGSTAGKTKLSGKESEIKALLDKKISISGIARLLGVNRLTVGSFIERRGLGR